MRFIFDRCGLLLTAGGLRVDRRGQLETNFVLSKPLAGKRIFSLCARVKMGSDNFFAGFTLGTSFSAKFYDEASYCDRTSLNATFLDAGPGNEVCAPHKSERATEAPCCAPSNVADDERQEEGGDHDEAEVEIPFPEQEEEEEEAADATITVEIDQTPPEGEEAPAGPTITVKQEPSFLAAVASRGAITPGPPSGDRPRNCPDDAPCSACTSWFAGREVLRCTWGRQDKVDLTFYAAGVKTRDTFSLSAHTMVEKRKTKRRTTKRSTVARMRYVLQSAGVVKLRIHVGGGTKMDVMMM